MDRSSDTAVSQIFCMGDKTTKTRASERINVRPRLFIVLSSRPRMAALSPPPPQSLPPPADRPPRAPLPPARSSHVDVDLRRTAQIELRIPIRKTVCFIVFLRFCFKAYAKMSSRGWRGGGQEVAGTSEEAPIPAVASRAAAPAAAGRSNYAHSSGQYHYAESFFLFH